MRCNGCQLKKYKKELGKRFLMLNNTIYEKGAEPLEGQGEPSSYKGQPIRFVMYGMSFGHSYDEDCEIG